MNRRSSLLSWSCLKIDISINFQLLKVDLLFEFWKPCYFDKSPALVVTHSVKQSVERRVCQKYSRLIEHVGERKTELPIGSLIDWYI